jgi:hypothetical protein
MKDILKIDIASIFTKNRILNIAIIIFALIIARNIYKNQAKTFGALRETKDTEIKKNNVLVDIARLEKNIDAYRNSLVKQEVSFIINTMRNIAKEMDIETILLKPLPEVDYAAYTKYFFSLTISAKDYHHVSKFISRIENFPDIFIMVESATFRPIFQVETDSRPYKIEVDLSLSTVFFRG